MASKNSHTPDAMRLSRSSFWLIGSLLLLTTLAASAQTPSTYEILDAFHGGTLIQATDGNFYGTTQWTVFRRTPSGEVTILHTFTGPDGAGPSALLQASDGKFYGSTSSGGAHDAGTIYRIGTDGSGFQTLWQFEGAWDGSGPSPLVQASDGKLYGVTAGGGAFGSGTIFSVDLGGGLRFWGVFDPNLNGSVPNGPLLEAGGLLCGTTQQGGADPSVGTVFCSGIEGPITTDYSFGGTDGALPLAPLINNDGQLFGTTWGGGSGDAGTIFLTSAGSFDLDTWHSFAGPEGANPAGPLALGDAIRGTTAAGGAAGFGTIFRLNYDHTVDVLHDFTGIDGRGPSGSLFQAADGFLYGTAGAGPYNLGVVFRMTNAAIALHQVFPTSGPSKGGAPVDVIGGGFEPGMTVTIGGVEATDVTVADPTFLHLLTPPLSTGTYDVKVTAPGGATATLPAAYVVWPAITSFTPTAGPVGMKVTINGDGFTEVASVKFNGKAASFNVLSPTQLTANVSAGTTSGKITITTSDGTATSATDFVVALNPTVTGFTPGSGPIGSTVVITGTNFDTATAVAFNTGSTTAFTINSSTQITATVPLSGSTGKIKVTNAAGAASSAGIFLVPPANIGFEPASAGYGQMVFISGNTFIGVNSVTFNGAEAFSFIVETSTRIRTWVPWGATTGKVGVTTSGGTAFSVMDFTVPPQPTITSFTPITGPIGTKVTINGTGFTEVIWVRFNGKSAAFTLDSSTQITATVNSGTTSGKITVTNPSGTATSAADFLVVHAPTVTGFTPGNGVPGTSVVITGTDFSTASTVAFNGFLATFTINSPTQITATVPPLATTGKIKVTNPAGGAYSVNTFLVPPQIASFTPASGNAGTVVTITGQTFNNASAVQFNGIPATFGINSPAKITATAPPGVTTGKIAVTTAGGTAMSATNFMVPPAITSFSPTAGPIGAKVTINGTVFAGVSSVKFNGKPASFGVLSPTQLSAYVSTGTTTGNISVTTSGGTAISAGSFVVVAPPTITGFSPVSGTPGTTVVITGSSFDTASAVAFNTASTSAFTINSPTQITVTVPSTATTGKIKVTNAAGAASSVAAFLVPPTITSFSPTSGRAGTSVVINGKTFNGASSVKFNGVAASFTVNTSVKITAIVPAGAATGKIAVTTPGGTTASATSFTVLP